MRGWLAYNEEGVLGLVTSDAPELREGYGSDPMWFGTVLRDKRNAEGKLTHAVDDTWNSLSPRLVADLNLVAPGPRADGYEYRCPSCSAELTAYEARASHTCPRCGFAGVPHFLDNDVIVRVNWDELRLLCDLANNWMTETKVLPEFQKQMAVTFGKIRLSRPAYGFALLGWEVEQEARQGQEVKSFAERAARFSRPGLVN